MPKKTNNNDTKVVDDMFLQFENIINQLSILKNQITGIQQNIKQLEKNVNKQMKGLKKNNVKTKNSNRQPSGFAKPSKVTKELCDFMNKKEGTEIARTEVTRSLVTYIKENKLENVENAKLILPDEKLKMLLGIEDGQELNYFNIQKYMNKHFVKNVEVKNL
jgi:chromatin remodeling complex protein RSC6